MDSDGEARNSSPEEKNPKRRMKTPFQLETLERVYAEDRYPTEAVRAELSLHLNLSDKQLQMWFCHRRLKDRKGKDDEIPNNRKIHKADRVAKGNMAGVLESGAGLIAARDRIEGYDDELKYEDHHHEAIARGSGSSHRRKGGGQETDMVPRKRNQLPVDRVFNPRMALAAVESQLGEPVRDDGPVLGMEFDPLPPGAFGAPIEQKSEQRVSTVPQQLHHENSSQDRQEARPNKAGMFGLPPLPTTGTKHKGGVGVSGQLNLSGQHLSRAPREFQFLPEQPTAREDRSHRQIQLNLHPNSNRSYEMGPASRISSLSPLGSFLPANLHLSSGHGYGFQQERAQNVAMSFLPDGEGRSGSLFAPNGLGLDEGQRQGLYHNLELEGQMDVHQSALQVMGDNQLLVGSDNRAIFHDHDHVRGEKKRKIEELKVNKESEAHVKRIRRDLERQEIIRRKKEEQMRRELEKQDRDKRKEEERVIRERQREEERIQREQRREVERQEKIAQKETKRMEKQHRKEEVRKAKEAAKLKAASERAAAKKLSKESMDTIDDEQLELLESATGQALLSMNGMMDDDSQLTDISKVVWKKFPPASVKMKTPLSVRPWNELEHTLGHLFMVWRFLTTFADVIGLWPFTLDEFAQALHDFESRLLGEIHVSLIKMMVKNIEDATQAAASGALGSQNAIALTSGGHPHIVEAAYEWGFDIQEWGRHVSPLTWPEILRQFALAAGYGPKWRKCNKEIPRPKENAEEHPEEENAVTILRSGAAAVSAVALMQGKGVGHLRRCRYRLTPGTVKYAAFHVLSLQGSKGLTILEVAEKIQKSGLRDLTTSKTPEASIAAALSRDTNLFERVAPSTYCVRPAFRKDPENTEEVLHSAKERIRLYQSSGCLDAEEGEKETDEAEEVERDEDYDSEGQDVEDGDVGAPILKDSDVRDELQAGVLNFEGVTDQEVEIDESQVGEPWVQGLLEGEYSDLSVEERLMALVALVNVVNEGNGIRLALEARMEAASALKRQMWAETQIERRRHKEEQLSRPQLALCPGAKNEGGDLSVTGDAGPPPSSTVEEKPNELVMRTELDTPLELNWLPNESSTGGPPTHERNLAVTEKRLLEQENVAVPGHVIERSRPPVKADIGISAEELYVVRSLPLGLDRRRNRYWQFVTCSGGQDPSRGRIYFESSIDGHWEVIDTEEALDALMMSLDVRGTREAGLHAVLVRLEGSLRLAMKAALRGSSAAGSVVDLTSEPAEAGTTVDGAQSDGSGALYSAPLEDSSLSEFKPESPESTGAIVVNLGKTDTEKNHLFEVFKDFEHWIWSENSQTLSALRVAKSGKKRETDVLHSCAKCHDIYWATDKHCQFCHATLGKSQAKQDMHVKDCEERMKKDPAWKLIGPTTSVPPRIQILKADIIAIEVAIPSEAFKDLWDLQQRKSWAGSLMAASTPTELLQSFTELECRVQREWLCSSYDTTKEALSTGTSMNLADSQLAPWVPHTSAAVGLRVMAFDAALSYSSEEKRRRQKQEEGVQNNVIHASIGVPSLRTTPDLPAADNQTMEEDGDILGDMIGSRGRGRGRGRGAAKSRGSRSKRSVSACNTKVVVKKGSKRKLQFQEEGTAAAEAEAKQGGKVGGRGQGRSRGRSRSRGTGRGRGRGVRGGRRTQTSARRNEKVPKEKNPNELMVQEPVPRSLFEESGVPEDDPESEYEVSKGEWEESEDQLEDAQEMDDEENMGAVVEDDGEDDVQADEAYDNGEGVDVDEEGQGDDVDEEEDDDRQYEEDSYDQREEEREDDDLEEAGDPDSDEDGDEDLNQGTESVRESDED